MVFSSSVFLFVFLPVVLIGYVILPQKLQNGWLLIASLFFYLWGGPAFFPIMLASICVNYLGGICIDRMERVGYRRFALGFFVGCNLLNLGYWKYTNFLVDIMEGMIGRDLAVNEVILPIGISFYTFQGISYVIDVYRKEVNVQKNPLYVALYIALFPQLIAGPIVRYTDIESDINKREKTLDNFEQGMIRFIFGLAKKVVLANTLGKIAEQVKSLPCEENTVFSLWIGLVAFALQIYYDFSGYSDMAIGLGRVFGFSFPENFNYPFISKNISEFWRRWHMSLSSWFRDYVYIPMGGSKKGNVYFNLFIIFFLTGVWHGANWTYIAWGVYYGIFIVIERWCKTHVKIKVPDVIMYLYTFIVSAIGFAIFNARDLEHAGTYILTMFGFLPLGKIKYTWQWYLDNYTIFLFLAAIIAATPLGKMVWAKMKTFLSEGMQRIVTYITVIALLLVSMMYVMTSTYNPFIYFQF